jgi:hypothetical protein
MAAGFTTIGQCFATPQEAIDAHFQTIKPYGLLTATGNSVFIEPIKLGTGVWQWKKWTITNTGVITTQHSVNAVNPQYGSCVLPDGLYNYTEATAMWGFAFITVLMHWLLAKKAGVVLNAIRRF